MSNRLLLLALLLFVRFAQPLQAQIQPSAPLSPEQARRYAAAIVMLRMQINHDVIADQSGELQYFINHNYEENQLDCWRKQVYQFMNPGAAILQYLTILNEFSALLQKSVLTDNDRRQLLQKQQSIQSFETYGLLAVDSSGRRPQRCTTETFNYAAPDTFSISIVPQRTSSNAGIEGAKVYLLTREHLLKCGCGDCLIQDYNACDVAELDARETAFRNRFWPGSFHIVITQKKNGLEKIIFYQRKKFTENDAGKTIFLKIPGY